jgi:hypothetical protein
MRATAAAAAVLSMNEFFLIFFVTSYGFERFFCCCEFESFLMNENDEKEEFENWNWNLIEWTVAVVM